MGLAQCFACGKGIINVYSVSDNRDLYFLSLLPILFYVPKT